MKRVLFLMSDTGGGHRAAAEALRDELVLRHGAANVRAELVDVFRNYSPPPFKYAPQIYPHWVNRAGSSWGMAFQLSNSVRRVRALSRGMYTTLESGLKRLLHEHPADVVVCVHSLLVRPAMESLHRMDARPPFVTVVTDLAAPHAFWFDPRVERCFVPTLSAYHHAVEAGMSQQRLKLSGLPVHTRFTHRPHNKLLARRMLGWRPDLPTILLVSGGDGIGTLDELGATIDAQRLPCQLAIVTGKNHDLKMRLEHREWNQPTHVYPFVKDMAALMCAADILVTKAGPATITEACVTGLPIILSGAIPGQETANVDYVVRNGAGVFAPQPSQVTDTIAAWLSNEDLRGQFAHNAQSLARPNAVYQIADEVWHYANQTRIPMRRRNVLTGLVSLPARISLL
ncbi:MAG: glycosyltransferase [Chloroflexi bacterium]|nr:MAG: glycosyltransferase [Chloroflexota bacterium]